MTQFSLSTPNDNHLAKSHQKATHILGANKMKTSLGLSSKSFYGSNVKTRLSVPYVLCGQAVRNTSENARPYTVGTINSSTEEKRGMSSSKAPKLGLLHIRHKSRKQEVDSHCHALTTSQLKSQSVPLLSGSKPQTLRTSLSSPPRKQRRMSSPRFGLSQDCRAKRVLTYEHEAVQPAADEANKENWEHAGEVNIHKILQTLDREMEGNTTGRTLEERVLGPVSDDEGDDNKREGSNLRELITAPNTETHTPTKQKVLPQDIGFPNPPGSNRCWMNATLQTLLGMEPFVEELERSRWREDRNSQSSLLRSFFEVVKYRRRGSRVSLHTALRHLFRSLGALDVMFTSDRQQDATEFLVRLLDLFREQFGSLKTDSSLEDRKLRGDNCTLRELQLENLPTGGSAMHRLSASRNPVCDNVEFRLKETYCCTSCAECTTKCQDHLALFLDIPPRSHSYPSMQEALNRYMQPDVRELKCGKCSGQRSKVVTAFTKLPRFLLLQVKRYAIQTTVTEKLTSLMRVPINLSVKNFVTDDVTMPVHWSSFKEEQSLKDEDTMQVSIDEEEDKDLQEAMQHSLDDSKKDEEEEDDLEALELEKAIKLSLLEQRLAQDSDCSMQMGDCDISQGAVEGEEECPDYSYRLISIIMHQGLSLNCGHYVADVYDLEHQQWFHYDDEVVTRPTEDEVIGNARQRNGYVFCYVHRHLYDQLSNRNVDTSWNW